VAAQSKAAMRAGNKAIQFLPTLRLGFFALCAKFRLDDAAGMASSHFVPRTKLKPSR
jgi:hypothetical protein